MHAGQWSNPAAHRQAAKSLTSFVLKDQVDNLRESIATETGRGLDGSFWDSILSLLGHEADLDLGAFNECVHCDYVLKKKRMGEQRCRME